jgi:hypothetical protein
MGHKPVPFLSYNQRTTACIDAGNWMKAGCPSMCYYGDQYFFFFLDGTTVLNGLLEFGSVT